MTLVARRPARPSSRYMSLACDGERLLWPGGDTAVFPRIVVAEARVQAQGEPVVWIHESAHHHFGLPDRLESGHAERLSASLGVPVRAVGGAGWCIADGSPPVHLAFPGYSGDFVGTADAGELLGALEAFRSNVGLGFLFSGASTLHQLIRTTSKLGDPVEPELPAPAWRQSGWAVPATSWSRPLDPLEARNPWVRAFDRSGSYLASWRGVALPDGPWLQLGRHVAEPGTESSRPCGYWLVDQPASPWPDLPDPFLRHGEGAGERVWITTPLLQLLVDLGREPIVWEGLVANERARPLEHAAARLAAAREALGADDSPLAAVALDALKVGYAAATAWFEWGAPAGQPLHRPSWRRTIVDRHAANTWRGLAQAKPAPFALTDVDTALFALPAPDAVPEIKLGTGLGCWKPKGRPLRIQDALDALGRGGPHAVLQLAEAD